MKGDKYMKQTTHATRVLGCSRAIRMAMGPGGFEMYIAEDWKQICDKQRRQETTKINKHIQFKVITSTGLATTV